jgi:hypothetical protein
MSVSVRLNFHMTRLLSKRCLLTQLKDKMFYCTIFALPLESSNLILRHNMVVERERDLVSICNLAKRD